MTAAVQLTEPCTFHGEGAFWDERAGRLRLVDMLAGALVTVDPSGETSRQTISDVVAVIRARRSGGYVLATEHGFALCDEHFAVQQTVEVLRDPGVRLNEGGCDPQGRLYVGSMAYAATPGAGTLYRLDASLAVQTALEDITIPNGLQWSADGLRAFHADTGTNRVDAFDFDPDAGTFSGRRRFIEVDPQHGGPDGTAIDAEGGLWVAMWGGAAVHRYSAAGDLLARVPLPVSNVTSCTFGGPDRSTLYVTTSRQGIPADGEPTAGAVFSVDTDTQGATVHAFAG